MRAERGGSAFAAPSWRVAALPSLAVLGIALPLTFAIHVEPFLYEFRAVDLLPIYATAWLVLALAAIPAWVVLALALAGLEKPQRAPFPLLARGLRIALITLAGVFAVEALIVSLQAWLGTFGRSVGIPSSVADLIAVAAGLLAALTASGRAQVRTIGAVATACTAIGALSLVSLAAFGWHQSGAAASAHGAMAGQPHGPGIGGGGVHPGPASAPPSSGDARPNIVLLTIDALSAPHMSLYGAARPTTPHLAAFAQQATTFDRAYANGNFTTPGIASILTGTMPWTHRALQLPVWPRDVTRRMSLPALLDRDGYRTGYVSTNAHAGGAAQGFGAYFQFARTDRTDELTLCKDGLSRYLRYICAAAELPPVAELAHIADSLRGPTQGNLEYDPRLAIDPALAWLDAVDRDRPIFLWVHLFPPHSPYAAPAPWLGRFDASPDARDPAHTQPNWAWLQSREPAAEVRTLEARYDESVAYVDYYAGEFLSRALELLGPNTVVVVTADHGESFAHGYGAHTGPGLYDEIIHVPLIIKLPGQTAGRRSEALAEQVDIAPTLAEVAGLAPPASWEGRSLLDECSASGPGSPSEPGRSDSADRPVFSMNFEQNPRLGVLHVGSVAVIDGNWKLVHYMGALHYPFMPALHDELYDLSADPGERVNLASARPAEVTRLRQLIDAELARHRAAVRAAAPAGAARLAGRSDSARRASPKGAAVRTSAAAVATARLAVPTAEPPTARIPAGSSRPLP